MRGRERRRHRRVTGRRSLLAVREAGDQEAEELARDDRESVFQGGAQERFCGRPQGWLEPR